MNPTLRQIYNSDEHGRHGRRGSQLTGRADDQGLRLVLFELQAVVHVPLSDVSGTSAENGETLGSVLCVRGKSELGVICVLMALDAMACDDVTHLIMMTS